jgi:hypothetical protein
MNAREHHTTHHHEHSIPHEAPTAIDPVCGMTVTIKPDSTPGRRTTSAVRNAERNSSRSLQVM